VAVKPYKKLITERLAELKSLSLRGHSGGPKAPKDYRTVPKPISRFFQDGGLNPHYMEDWFWLLFTLAEIHYQPTRSGQSWTFRDRERLAQAVGYLRGKNRTLSNEQLCTRLCSHPAGIAAELLRIDPSGRLSRLVKKTKSPTALYRQYRYAMREAKKWEDIPF
jgi:hypothetical protein